MRGEGFGGAFRYLIEGTKAARTLLVLAWTVVVTWLPCHAANYTETIFIFSWVLAHEVRAVLSLQEVFQNQRLAKGLWLPLELFARLRG